MIRVLLCLVLLAWPVRAQELSALARLDAAASRLEARAGGVRLVLALSQPVPWRVRVLDQPPRVVLDFREVDWTGLDLVAQAAPGVTGLRAGVFRPGWSRLVLDLDQPLGVRSAQMVTEGAVQVVVDLAPVSGADFAKAAGQPEPEGWALPKAASWAPGLVSDPAKLVVVLDPGHGGLDPGAERGKLSEAGLMLTFARELKELLLRDGGFDVALTREADVFVPLETRISLAHQAGAEVFLSLHADAIPEGEAVGATVYTLAEAASDKASETLAERHNRDDLLAGLDLSAQDDRVARVLMDLARAETMPRTDRLAAALVASIRGAGLKMHRRPQQEAGFAVLKSADIPSVLVELGFMSSQSDLERLSDPAWRKTMQQAILEGLKTWGEVEAAAP